MNAQVQTEGQSTTPAAPAPAKKKTEVETVKMTDGRTVDFPGKTKILKDALVGLSDGTFKPIDELSEEELASAHVGALHIRMDFRNGATRLYPINPKLGLRFAAHGGLQKYGDQLAGEDAPDLDDWAASTDALHEQLHKNAEWSKARVGGGMAGTSVLLQALMEFSGRSQDEVKAFTKDWTPQMRQAMRNDPDLKPIIDRIEKEKAAVATAKVDTGSLKAGLMGLASAQSPGGGE